MVDYRFGTIKALMTMTHHPNPRFRTINTAFALNILAFNVKKMIAIISVRRQMDAPRA